MKINIIAAMVLAWNVYTYTSGSVQPTFVLHHKEASMPVVVRGNLSSGVMIIFLHGGPGGTGLKKIGIRAFDQLEKKFGLVYWDQRGGDGARGGTSPSLMNLDQFVEDIDVLVDRLHDSYPNTKIFLMGHCWGGGLAVAYMADNHRENKITGWIDVAGAHNNPKGDSLSIAWVKRYAMERINKNEDAAYWKRALKYYNETPVVLSNDLTHYQYVRKSHGYQLVEGDTLGTFPGYTPGDLLHQPVRYISYYVNYYYSLNKFLVSDIDLTAQMRSITLPSLVIWGDCDGLVPVEMAYEALNALGTLPEHKQIAILKNTAHTIFYERPVEFVAIVEEFIDRYASVPTSTSDTHWNAYGNE